jgi:hypothetical protein
MFSRIPIVPVCPFLRRNWVPPPPPRKHASALLLPPWTQRGGGEELHSLAVQGLGGPKEILALCILCDSTCFLVCFIILH